MPRATLGELKLLVSELVTNAVKHGTKDPSDAIVLDLRLNGAIECAVIDAGPGFRHEHSAADSKGWGLMLVERLTDRWGVTRSHNCTRVWFEMRAP